MAHIAYPSTPNFKNFKTDYRPPTKATFFGTVKLHGTNATLVFGNGRKVNPQIQSRSWVITDNKKDNCGTFALLSKAPLSALVDQILAVRGEGPKFREIYIAGEIAGKGVQKGVAIVAWSASSRFSNIRIDGHWMDMRNTEFFNVAQYKTFEVDIDFRSHDSDPQTHGRIHGGGCTKSVPFGSSFVDGAGQPISGRGEGIVWTMVRSPYMDESDGREFDDTMLVNFKTKGETFSATSQTPKEQKNLDPNVAKAAVEFADYALAERRFEQVSSIWRGNRHDRANRAFIKWVTEDAIKEERNEMERLAVPEKEARRELSGRAKLWYARKCREIADGLTAA
ncbi:hypothetical protein DFH06DRAFT_1256106 [Mycena polygramma]|nr:hypothetical protein DFH06DRAFT_1256106 [Mycena polygramma]